MIPALIFIGLLFFITILFLIYLVFSMRTRDDMILRDLVDRIMAGGDTGAYLTLLYQRQKLGLQKNIPWNKVLVKKENTPVQVPSMGEVEKEQMDREMKEWTDKQEKEKKRKEELEKQSAERVAQGRDAGGVM